MIIPNNLAPCNSSWNPPQWTDLVFIQFCYPLHIPPPQSSDGVHAGVLDAQTSYGNRKCPGKKNPEEYNIIIGQNWMSTRYIIRCRIWKSWVFPYILSKEETEHLYYLGQKCMILRCCTKCKHIGDIALEIGLASSFLTTFICNQESWPQGAGNLDPLCMPLRLLSI